MTKLGRLLTHYSLGTKRYHVEEILKRRISVFSYAKEVGISSASLYRWMDKFSEFEEMKEKQLGSNKSSEHLELKMLQEENARLKVQLESERLKREAYQRMIVVAEKTFKIQIEKKSGAKRSKK